MIPTANRHCHASVCGKGISTIGLIALVWRTHGGQEEIQTEGTHSLPQGRQCLGQRTNAGWSHDRLLGMVPKKWDQDALRLFREWGASRRMDNLRQARPSLQS